MFKAPGSMFKEIKTLNLFMFRACRSLSFRVCRGMHLHLHLCLILILSSSAYSQSKNTYPDVGMTIEHFRTPRIDTSFHNPTMLLISHHSSDLKVRSPYVQQSFELKVQPFFCRIESQIERKSGIAARFRLGSVDYTNWLEGKSYLKE